MPQTTISPSPGSETRPAEYKPSRTDDSMPYDAGHTEEYDDCFDRVWDDSKFRNNVIAAFSRIIEHRCPKDDVIYLGFQNRFQHLDRGERIIDDPSSRARLSYRSACKRYIRGVRAAEASLSDASPRSPTSEAASEGTSHTSTSEASSESLHSAPWDRESSTSRRLLETLIHIPKVPDLIIHGSDLDRTPGSRRRYRYVCFVDISPGDVPLSDSKRHVTFFLQALKYAVFARDMQGSCHTLQVVGMAFRRIVCDRATNDVYVDVGRTTMTTNNNNNNNNNGQEDLEVVDMSLSELTYYGFVDGAIPISPPSGRTHSEPATAYKNKNKSSHEAKAPVSTPTPDSAGNLFYHLSKPDPDPDPSSSNSKKRPQSDIDARNALFSFFHHMGRSHYDVLRQVDTTPSLEGPLSGLTGKWARVRDVTLYDLGWAVGTVGSRWSDLPGDTPNRAIDFGNEDEDIDADMDLDRDDDYDPTAIERLRKQWLLEQANNKPTMSIEETLPLTSPSTSTSNVTSGAQTETMDQTGSEDAPDERAVPDTDESWDAVAAFQRERRERREEHLRLYEPFTRVPW